jgi:methionine-rich copper-binding protein CopC
MKQFVLGCLALLALVVALGAGAHTTVEKTKPATDAPLDSSPPTIEIRFKHPVQMTSVVVLDAAKSERKLAFTPATSAALITINEPDLLVGRNEIRWKGLSKDGHVITGTLLFVVKQSSANP